MLLEEVPADKVPARMGYARGLGDPEGHHRLVRHQVGVRNEGLGSGALDVHGSTKSGLLFLTMEMKNQPTTRRRPPARRAATSTTTPAQPSHDRQGLRPLDAVVDELLNGSVEVATVGMGGEQLDNALQEESRLSLASLVSFTLE